MAELNAALKKERLEKASLQQTLQQAEATSEESEEKSRMIEKLKQELLALQDDNRRVLSKAFSNDDASDLARAKQEVAIRDAEVKKLKEQIKKERELQKQNFDAAARTTRDSLAHAEREEARRTAEASGSLREAVAERTRRRRSSRGSRSSRATLSRPTRSACSRWCSPPPRATTVMPLLRRPCSA